MQRPGSASLDAFWEQLATAGNAALLLDYDGTLAPFHNDPAQAYPYPGVETLLDHLNRLASDRVIIVSGRALDHLRPLLKLHRPVEMWGSHGRERQRLDGTCQALPIPPQTRQALTTVESWQPAIEALGGRLERKPSSLAFHWRGLPEARCARLREELQDRFAGIDASAGLLWHEFNGGIELRAAGADKGQVIRQIVAEQDASFPAGHTLAYLGDDHTDEDAFEALADRGLGILVRDPWRPTAARHWLRPPEEMLQFLEQWLRVRNTRRS